MKLKHYSLITFISLTAGHSAINFQADGGTGYTANADIIGLGDVGSAWENIELTASADTDGNLFRFRNTFVQYHVGAGGLAMGDSITFNFQFNMDLATGPKFGGSSPPARGGMSFRIFDSGVALDVSTAITMTGGTDTLENFFGVNAPTNGDMAAENAGIAYFNPTTTAEVAFHTWSTDGATFDSFTNSGSTMNFTEGTADPNIFAVTLGDSSVTRSSTDFSYDAFEIVVTNNSATAIPQGAEFRFTFEGANQAEQTAIPEPTSFALLGLSSLTLLRRKRK